MSKHGNETERGREGREVKYKAKREEGPKGWSVEREEIVREGKRT